MKVFKYDFKKSIKQTLPYIVIFLVISIVLVQIGIAKVNSIFQEEKDLLKVESNLIKRYISYHQYGVYGARLKYSPKIMAALFSESIPCWNLTAFIDIGIRKYLYKEISDENIVSQNGYMDLSWFLKIIGSLLVLIWGWKAFEDKDILKFLISNQSGRIKKEIIMSRIAIIFIVMMLIFGQIMIQFFIAEFSFDVIHLAEYLSVVFMVYVICFLLAAFFGIKSTKKKKIIIGVLWLIFVMILPDVVKIYFDKEARGTIENRFVIEMIKADVIMEIENEAFDKAERYPFKEQKFKVNSDSAIKWRDVDSKRLEKLAKRLTAQLERVIEKYQFVSSLTAMTFLDSTGREVSSQGYNGYLNFQGYTMENQRNFMDYVVDKLYLKAPYYGPVFSFQKEGENIFHFNSTLPRSFIFGAIWHLVQMLLLLFINFWKFDKVIFCDEREKLNFLKLTINQGKVNILISNNEELKQHLFNFCTEKMELKGTLNFVGSPIKYKPLYVCGLKKIESNFTTKNLSEILGEKFDEQAGHLEVLFNFAKKNQRFLILDGFLKDLTDNEIKEIIEKIKEKQLMTLIISDSQYLAFEIADIDDINTMPGDNSLELLSKLKDK